jgi:hypothetical protein
LLVARQRFAEPNGVSTISSPPVSIDLGQSVHAPHLVIKLSSA